MGNKTKIEWADATFNPIMGCTPISTGCKNCYARAMMKRFAGKPGWPDSPDTVTLYPDRLEQPFRWRKPRRVFVNSMSDLFHDDVDELFLDDIFTTIALTPHCTYMVLTKRPKRMLAYLKDAAYGVSETDKYGDASYRVDCDDDPDGTDSYHAETARLEEGVGNVTRWQDGTPLPNVHIGVSVEDQPTADERIPLLLRTPAVKRFVSCEPLLGPLNLSIMEQRGKHTMLNPLKGGFYGMTCGGYAAFTKIPDMNRIDQVIVGSETGPGARPMELDWARSIRDQCVAANVPFFFKRDSNGNRELDGKIWEELC